MSDKREAYEDEAHPSTVGFWQDFETPEGRHLYGDHPVLSQHGHDLSKAGFEYTGGKLGERGLNFSQQNIGMPGLARIAQQIFMKESQHKEELIEHAKDIVARTWGIPKSKLKAELTNQIEMSEVEDEDEDEDEPDFGGPTEEPEPTEGHEKEIHKRVTMNLLSQGAAMHNMMTIHHAIVDALNEVDPELIELYDKLSGIAQAQQWIIDIHNVLGMAGIAATGMANVERQQDQMVVKAKAIMFPILVQELIKGVMELLSLHHLGELDDHVYKHVTKQADKLTDEPLQLQVGPALWRKFLAVRPKDISLAEIVTKLAKMSPDRLHYVIGSIITHPKDAKELLES
jgi:hypothetical protein